MAEITYPFNAGTGALWTNPAYAWDSDAGTRATRAIPKGGTNDAEGAADLLATGNTAPGTNLGTITAVEVAMTGYHANDTDNREYIRPSFNGSAGDAHELVAWGTGEVTEYVAITTDTNAPSPWTWAAIQTLDVKLWGVNSKTTATRIVSVNQFSVRVTYTPAGGSYSLEGSLSCASDLTASAVLAAKLAGALAGVGGVSGAAVLASMLVGELAGVSGLAGSAKTEAALAGVLTSTSELSGNAKSAKTIAGSFAGASSLSGDAITYWALGGVVVGQSASAGAVLSTQALDGTLAGVSGAAGAVFSAQALAGALFAISTLVGHLGTTGGVPVVRPKRGMMSGTRRLMYSR